MKKLLLLLVTLLLVFSCVPEDDDRVQFHIEFVPAVSVELPESFTRGETYEIKVKYNRPTDCHYFDGFYYEASGHIRTVAVQTIVIEDANCEPLVSIAPEESSFNFYCNPTYADNTYTFKFYTGQGSNGAQEFMEVEVPVVQ